MPTVVFADDHPLLLRGLQDLMTTAPEFAVVAATGSGAEALSIIETVVPDLAVLDLSMPYPGGMDIQRTIVERRLPVRTVLLTATLTRSRIEEALELDVWGLVLKESAPNTLLDSMRQVYAGRRWLPPDLIARIAERPSSKTRRPTNLTQRERDVAALVCEGLSNRTVASRLTISEGTVGMHLQNIYVKLNVNNRTMLATLHLRNEVARGD